MATKVKTIGLYTASRRVEATLLTESERGFGVLMPAEPALKPRQTVYVIRRKNVTTTKVAYVEPHEQGQRVGLTVVEQ